MDAFRLNLKMMRERVERILQHFPDTPAWRNEVRDRINDHASRLADEADWPFMVKEQRLLLKAEQTFTSGEWTANPLLIGVPQTQAISIPFADFGWPNLDIGSLPGSMSVSFSPQVGILSDEFVVEGAATVGADLFIYLDPRFNVSPAGTETVTIRFRRYVLPRDLADVRGVTFRSDDRTQPLEELVRWEELQNPIRETDGPGVPVCFIDSMSSRISRWPGWVPDLFYEHRDIDPPIEAPSLAAAAGTGLDPNTTYEYRYVWAWAGMVSPPSPIAEITTPAATNLQVNVTTPESGESQYLRSRWVFRRKKGTTRWLLAALSTDPSANPILDAGGVDTRTTMMVQTSTGIQGRDIEFAGAPRFLRVYPRPSSDMDAFVSYQKVLRPVEADTDVFDWPDEASRCVVHRVAAELAGQRDNPTLAEVESRLGAESRRVLGSRYLSYSAGRMVKRNAIAGPGATGHLLRLGKVNYVP